MASIRWLSPPWHVGTVALEVSRTRCFHDLSDRGRNRSENPTPRPTRMEAGGSWVVSVGWSLRGGAPGPPRPRRDPSEGSTRGLTRNPKVSVYNGPASDRWLTTRGGDSHGNHARLADTG